MSGFFMAFVFIDGHVPLGREVRADNIEQVTPYLITRYGPLKEGDSVTVYSMDDWNASIKAHQKISKCVGCGVCCTDDRCPIGPQPTSGKCPFLTWDEPLKRHWCQKLLDFKGPEKDRFARALQIDVAQGPVNYKGCGGKKR